MGVSAVVRDLAAEPTLANKEADKWQAVRDEFADEQPDVWQDLGCVDRLEQRLLTAIRKLANGRAIDAVVVVNVPKEAVAPRVEAVAASTVPAAPTADEAPARPAALPRAGAVCAVPTAPTGRVN